MIVAGLIFALAIQAVPQQTTSSPATSATQQNAPKSDDIVVTGLPDLDDPKSAVTHRTLSSGKIGGGPQQSAAVFALAERFTKCAITPGMRDTSDLRAAIDGVINSPRQSFGQTQFVKKHSTCAQDVFAAQHFGNAAAAGGYDSSYYDRGAMTLRIVQLFSPDLTLTKDQTADADVQARFNLREIPLAKFRLPTDRRFFEMAICQVRQAPELSVRLIKANGYDEITRTEAAIVNATPDCTGHAKKVFFDFAQFRFYIADAVYRWAVAAKGVDTLIPTS
ncbi:hypothetical protein [Sphingomonas sp. MA1305]|uniref:hypothetical protein n=1 Tax=Sphingomonas sp. MA1305 TaxID=2479204 RepID=UPI001E42BEBD|nr:hypothetical protein [Sphingomonas sp. MA1305]